MEFIFNINNIFNLLKHTTVELPNDDIDMSKHVAIYHVFYLSK